MFRNFFTQAVGLSILPFAPFALAQTTERASGMYGYRHGPGMMWGRDAWGGFGMILMPIFVILVLGGIAFGILFLLRAKGMISLGRNAVAPHHHAVALLQERYARGEIDTKEFEERRRLLVR